ncbi:hypothetical protein ACSVDA_24035 [Cytobacillus sp. Hm23]
MLNNVSKIKIFSHFSVIIISFLQAYTRWQEDRMALSLFFLIGGMAILVLTLISIGKSYSNQKVDKESES